MHNTLLAALHHHKKRPAAVPSPFSSPEAPPHLCQPSTHHNTTTTLHCTAHLLHAAHVEVFEEPGVGHARGRNTLRIIRCLGCCCWHEGCCGSQHTVLCVWTGQGGGQGDTEHVTSDVGGGCGTPQKLKHVTSIVGGGNAEGHHEHNQHQCVFEARTAPSAQLASAMPTSPTLHHTHLPRKLRRATSVSSCDWTPQSNQS